MRELSAILLAESLHFAKLFQIVGMYSKVYTKVRARLTQEISSALGKFKTVWQVLQDQFYDLWIFQFPENLP